MKKSILSLLAVLAIFFAKAQSPQYFNAYPAVGSTIVNNYPLSSTIYNKAQWIFGPNEFNTGGTGIGAAAYSGNITKIFLRLGSAVSTNPYTNFVISLSQNVGTSTSFGTSTNTTLNFVTGMSQCFSLSSFSLTSPVANSWYGFNLTNSFPYNPNLSLVVEIKVAGGSGNGIRMLSGTSPQRLYGAYASGSGTNASGELNFGFNLIPTPAPVSVLNFDGYKESHSDVLKWSTSSEINNASFTVQYSNDGIHFLPLEKVNSKATNGNSSIKLDYQLSNNKPVIGHNYYKLEQMDIDGTVSIHSKVIDLVRTDNNSPITLYPNPAKSLVTLVINADKISNLTVKLNGLNGNVLRQIVTTVQPGMNQIPIDILELSSGNYMIQVLDKDVLMYTSKITKE